MTGPDDATLNQLRAADPGASTWLSANAGSGKTRVLTDRVARLLLRGTNPQNILCLTYTKAAAAEMQNRLFQRLGGWAMLPDSDLRRALADLGEDPPDDSAGLARARRLFAQALETPGGLRIQTIHAFCAGLLRRFPLEAGVSPQFAEMEDRATALLRAEVADAIAAGPDGAVVDALAAYLGGDDIAPLLTAIAAEPDRFAAPFDEAGLRAALDLDPDQTEATLAAPYADAGVTALLTRLVALCAEGSPADRKDAERLRPALPCGPVARLAILEDVLLFKGGAAVPFGPRTGKFPTRATRDKAPDLMEDLATLMDEVAAAQPRRLGLALLARSRALHAFGALFVAEYERRKLIRGVVDFDDLIRKARHLLEDRERAQWVLFKLDGGIDHILVDEAQDTSPAQWAVIRGLAQEFAAGEGARAGVERTIFVVGDPKQSIYSFQGADPDGFDRMRAHFAAELGRVQRPLHDGTLAWSFRSSPAILRAVDCVFQGEHLDGIGAEAPMHRAFHADMPGRVDLWPAVEKEEAEGEDGHWTEPVDRIGKRHPGRLLADRIADAVQGMVGQALIPGARAPDGTHPLRPVTEGDVLILVQRRSDMFHAIIGALKARGLRVAGADRLRVGAELAVRDIGAVLRFLALAEDDLSLAEALRSPLLGWDEQALFSLAAHRPAGATLWQALRGAAGHDETRAILDDLRTSADFLRPFDLITRLLIRHDGRRRLLARLGAEAEDGIDALLSQALAYEGSAVPSLTGFVEWMQTDDTDLKRQMESRGTAIRVMTVHGAKGLEAPVVILPDCARPQAPRGGALLATDAGVILPAAKEQAPPLQTDLREAERAAQERERRRLLYVAMTRAESWLIVAAAGETGTGGDSWHAMVEEGLGRAGATVHPQPGGDGLRLDHGDWAGPVAEGPPAAVAPPEPAPAPLPGRLPAPTPAAAPPSPSALGGAKAMPGDSDPDLGEAAMARGTLLHLLLEHLPQVAPGDRPALAAAIAGSRADPALIPDPAAIAEEALRLLADPALAHVFAPGTRAEVPIAAPLPFGGDQPATGSIDRLIVVPDGVTAVDYKTNRIVPDRPEDVPEGILRQMGAYRAMLGQVFADRPVTVAILWTASGRLMPLPDPLVMAALQRAQPA